MVSAAVCFGISIHALREEGDLFLLCLTHAGIVFLSTPSARRATFFTAQGAAWSGHFYPRPPRGGRRSHRSPWIPSLLISIHALREEGDRGAALIGCTRHLFLSTPSARRATLRRWGKMAEEKFLSTPSARRATPSVRGTTSNGIFLSTPSARRATRRALTGSVASAISIHALREEGDAGAGKC